MYKRFLVIASQLDTAGMNIVNQLEQFRENPVKQILQSDENSFDIYICEKEIVYTENLDLEKISKYDFIIFASKHSSAKGEKALAVHSVGNWRNADFGGESNKVGKTSALFMKQIFEKLNENVEKFDLRDYLVTMEATHHGPLIDRPCLFIELGSSEIDYRDKRAGFVIAKTIADIIKEFKENPYSEIAVAIGGPHYCPNFNKLQKDSNVAISFVIPNYKMPFTEQMILEAVEKTEENVDFILIDWKGVGKAEERDALIKLIEKNYLQWRKTGDFK